MKNVLVFSYARQGYQEACQLEAAKEFHNNGDNVTVITCGSCNGICNDNHLGDSLRCSICKKIQIQRVKKIVSPDINVICIDDLCTKHIKEQAKAEKLEYHNINELKKLTFRGIEVGYGALSSYVSYTRNIDICFDGKVKEYFDYLIRMQIRIILIIEKLLSELNPDLFVIHNARYAHYKPVYGMAVVNGIDLLITETIIAADGTIMREFFNNGIPHDIVVKDNMMREFWDKYPDVERREAIARTFYENRKNAKFAGDTIYVKDQKLGKLPDNWDSSKENIVIFNSSEDEYFAISSKYDNYSLFTSQLDGVVEILEKYKYDKTKHFTLRVHPNLKNLTYHYHQDLYKLTYPNLSIIPADSDISTYSILDAADKVIVFGSTMGIESCYWGKPTINLAYALYENMDVTYYPKTKEELFDLIDSKDLQPKDSNNALLYGLYYMSNKHVPFKYVNVGKASRFNFWGRPQIRYNYYTILGSNTLYNYMEKSYSLLNRYFPLFSKFNKVPV